MKQYNYVIDSLWEKNYRLNQINHAVYKELVLSWDEISTLPEKLREELKAIPLFPLTVITKQTSSKDWTQKVLFETADWLKVESVLMRHHWRRNTVCVSCQVGCAMNCSFCATWKMWLKRNLSSDEIIAQVLYFQRELKEEESWVTNIVFMWMGEPFMNYNEVIEAIWTFHDQKKFWLSARHITISTSWIPKWIIDLSNEPLQLNLAVSIHAWTDELRSSIMPVNLQCWLDELVASIDFYLSKCNRKIFYEYIMLKWINDDPSQAEALSRLIKHQLAHVNIIPFNEIWDESLESCQKPIMLEFQRIFESHWIPSTIRVSLWSDIDWACWQLSAKKQD